MNKHPLSALMRVRDVKRWHTVNTIRQQTLADHSWAVTIIVLALYDEMLKRGIVSGVPTSETIIKALMHDVDEVYTGDVPAPQKDAQNGAGHKPVLFLNAVDAIIGVADAIEALHWITDNWAGAYTKMVVVEDCKTRLSRRLGQACDQFFGDDFRDCVDAVIAELA